MEWDTLGHATDIDLSSNCLTATKTQSNGPSSVRGTILYTGTGVHEFHVIMDTLGPDGISVGVAPPGVDPTRSTGDPGCGWALHSDGDRRFDGREDEYTSGWRAALLWPRAMLSLRCAAWRCLEKLERRGGCLLLPACGLPLQRRRLLRLPGAQRPGLPGGSSTLGSGPRSRCWQRPCGGPSSDPSRRTLALTPPPPPPSPQPQAPSRTATC
jgi:hypothetical protein